MARLLTALLLVAGLGLGCALWRARAAATAAEARALGLARELAAARYDAKAAHARVTELEEQAVRLDTELGTTKARTTVHENRRLVLDRELTATRARLDEREERLVALMAERETLRRQAAADLPAPAANPAAVADRRRLADLEAQVSALLTRALATAPAPAAAAPNPAAPPPFQIVRLGAGGAFVVVDYGAGHGARPGERLAVIRGHQLVARAQLSETRDRFSIAQIEPASLKGQLQIADLVVIGP